MKDRTHDDAMAEMYREDPAYAIRLLNSILEDGDQSELLIALRQMAKAFGGVQSVAEQAHLNPTQLTVPCRRGAIPHTLNETTHAASCFSTFIFFISYSFGILRNGKKRPEGMGSLHHQLLLEQLCIIMLDGTHLSIHNQTR